MGYIVDKEAVLLAFLKALPIYHLLKFCAPTRYLRGLVLLNETEISTAVVQEAALSIPRLYVSLPTTVDALPQLQYALLAAVVVEAAGISAEDPSGDTCRAAVARGFSILVRTHKYVQKVQEAIEIRLSYPTYLLESDDKGRKGKGHTGVPRHTYEVWRSLLSHY
jgi:hypothetical protein